MVNFKVNGTDRAFDGDPDMPLLWYLRDDLRLTGTRFGCGAGLCGACTVHVDGQAVRSCQTPVRTLQNKRVITIEGLSADGTPPGPARVGHAQRRPVRLLPDRPDHVGRGAADAHRQSERSGHRPRHGGQHLPVRHLSAHPRRGQGGGEGAGMSAIENVSRREFLGGVFSTGAFVLAAQVVPRVRVGAGRALPHAGRIGGAQPERLSRHRARRLGLHRDAPLRDGHRHPDHRCRRWRPTSSTRTGAASPSSRASAIRATATRTPTARDRSATSTKRSAMPAPRRGRCW